jgi:hypothetical protein
MAAMFAPVNGRGGDTARQALSCESAQLGELARGEEMVQKAEIGAIRFSQIEEAARPRRNEPPFFAPCKGYFRY